MIHCEHCEELINARLDGQLTEADALLLEEHLARCPACQALDRDLTTLQKRLGRLAQEPPEDLAASVMARLEGAPIQAPRKKKGLRAALACAAAALVLVVALSPQLAPFGRTGGDSAAAESASAPEAAATAGDAAPAEGAPAAEEKAAADTELLLADLLTEAQALDCLEEYLSQRGLEGTIESGSLSQDGSFWTFPVRDPISGTTVLYIVHCTDGSVEETPHP